VIATQAVGVANPDGNTLLITTPAHLINALLRKQNYDPFSSFEPICRLVDVPNFLAVNSESAYRSLNDLVTAARTTPGQLTVATNIATAAHLALEDFKRRANIDLTFVPYPGAGPAVTALLGGHITSMIDSYAAMAEHVKAGKLRVLATYSPTRVEGLEQIPTFAESGYNEYVGWFGLLAPANVSKATASELIEWTTEAMAMPDAKRKLEPLGLYPVKTCGGDFAALLRKQNDDFGRIIREANIKAE
jgi:tripartite-type tricarboxylate transporter receptor subunit TctC